MQSFPEEVSTPLHRAHNNLNPIAEITAILLTL